jgi:hypothetical protein
MSSNLHNVLHLITGVPYSKLGNIILVRRDYYSYTYLNDTFVQGLIVAEIMFDTHYDLPDRIGSLYRSSSNTSRYCYQLLHGDETNLLMQANFKDFVGE